MALVLTVLAGLLGAAAMAGSAYLLVAAWAVRRFVATPAATAAAVRPPVTLLKPLCGDEPQLYENLRGFCTQVWPEVQIVFGLRDPTDPAAAIVRRLQAEFPDAAIDLAVDGRVSGANLKIANLINMLPLARHDLLVIADSDMIVGPHYLDAVAAPFADPATGLVTCLYVGRPTCGLWSRLGAAFINHGFLPSVLVGKLLGAREGCFGATMALTRRTLERLGGLESLKDTLADDYALGAAVRGLGLKVVICREIVGTVVHEPDAATLLRHELRWVRTMKVIAPADMAASVVTHPVGLALLAAALSAGAPWAWGVLAVATCCRQAMVAACDHALRLPKSPPWLVLQRDVLSFGLLIAGFCGSRVAWRDRNFRVDRKGQLVMDRDPLV